MSPSSGRWRPRRAGIVNLYEYANQVFEFAGGRLAVARPQHVGQDQGARAAAAFLPRRRHQSEQARSVRFHA